MKKFLKIMLCIMGSLLAVIVAFWFSISYLILRDRFKFCVNVKN